MNHRHGSLDCNIRASSAGVLNELLRLNFVFWGHGKLPPFEFGRLLIHSSALAEALQHPHTQRS